MKHFLKPNPNAINPEIRRPAIRERLAVGLLGSAAVATCAVMYRSTEAPGPKMISILFGFMGGLSAAMPLVVELAERYDHNPPGNEGNGDGGNGGGGWEPPEPIEPRGPGGIPIPVEGELVNEIEEFLKDKSLVSV